MRIIVKRLWYFITKFKNKKILSKNSEIKNKYSGPCHIVATGVSINDYDLDLLPEDFKIGLGFIQYNNKLGNYYFDAYVDVDPVSTFKRLLKGKYAWFYSSIDKKMMKKDSMVFFRTSVRGLIKNNNLFKENKVYFVDVSVSDSDQHHNDITKRFPLVQGGISACISIAMFMGFKKIYLHGAGYTYKPMQIFHYYEEYLDITDKEEVLPNNFFDGILKISQSTAKNDINMMIDKIEKDRKVKFHDFVIRGDKPIARFIKNNEDDYSSYKVLKDYALEHGVEIINVVTDGTCPGVFNSVTSAELTSAKGIR